MTEPVRTVVEQLDAAREGEEFGRALTGFFDALAVLRDSEEAAEVDDGSECYVCGDGIESDGQQWWHVDDSIDVDGQRVVSACEWGKPWKP